MEEKICRVYGMITVVLFILNFYTTDANPELYSQQLERVHKK